MPPPDRNRVLADLLSDGVTRPTQANPGLADALSGKTGPSHLNRPFAFEARGVDDTLRRMAAQVSAKNPRLGNMETILTQGTGPYPVEAFPASEPDNPFYGEGRPTVQFNTNKQAPWATPEQMFLGEHLHFLNQDDPEFRGLKQKFWDSMGEDQQQAFRDFYEKDRAQGEARSFEQWLDRSSLDQAIHAVMTGRGDDWAGGLFGPQQQSVADEFWAALRRRPQGGP